MTIVFIGFIATIFTVDSSTQTKIQLMVAIQFFDENGLAKFSVHG